MPIARTLIFPRLHFSSTTRHRKIIKLSNYLIRHIMFSSYSSVSECFFFSLSFLLFFPTFLSNWFVLLFRRMRGYRARFPHYWYWVKVFFSKGSCNFGRINAWFNFQLIGQVLVFLRFFYRTTWSTYLIQIWLHHYNICFFFLLWGVRICYTCKVIFFLVIHHTLHIYCFNIGS